MLEAYGLPVVAERVATTLEETLAVADELGYPVVVKVAAAGVHKTEQGGVALDLRDPGMPRRASRHHHAGTAARAPVARSD